MPIFSAAGAGTSNSVFTLNVSIDPTGATYTTTGPISYTVAANGTNTVNGLYWIMPTNFVNVFWVKLSSFSTTQTNLVTLTDVKYSIVGP
jgi:hypothetical protein